MAGVSQASLKKNTVKTYQSILSKLTTKFGERDLNSLTPEEILSFLTQINQNTKQTTKRTRYSQLTSFFNFVTQKAMFTIDGGSTLLRAFSYIRANEPWQRFFFTGGGHLGSGQPFANALKLAHP